MRMKNKPAMVMISLLACIVFFNNVLGAQKTIQATRTTLHVARSLDPDSMESVSVKTKTGDLATIIVKKRHSRSGVNITKTAQPVNASAEPTNYVLISSSSENKPFSTVNESASVNLTSSKLDTANVSEASTTQQNRTERSEGRVPEPVYVSSAMVYVKNDNSSPSKKAKSLIKVDTDGIPVITGVRVPDDDTDRQVWRNARVINGILVPYDKGDKETASKYKLASQKPTTHQSGDNQHDNWMKIVPITKKPTKVTATGEPPFMKTDVWNENKWYMYKKPITSKPQINEQTTILQTVDQIEDVERTRPMSNQYTQHPTGIWMAADPEENPEHKYVTDRILEYIRNINKEEMKRLSIQKFTSRDARMLPSGNDEQPQIQSRILHVSGASVFPNSAMYDFSSTQTPSRVSFEEGVRTPVLQYAHPEYGVQSAKSEITPSDMIDKKDTAFYAEDIHADRGPFVFEPAAPATNEPDSVSSSSKRSHTVSPYFQRPKKTFAYFYPEKHSYMPSYSDKPYSKHSLKDNYKINEYPPNVYYEDMDGRPFWIRLGDSLKEQVQSGIDKMTDLTRPVVEPLVEATQKISHNLGFTSGNRDMSTIREKLGGVSGSSLLLPAIGIVAGGAALGLGAVAVGRYLNYDVVKMRSGKSIDGENLLVDPAAATHLEALWAEDNSRSAIGSVANTPSSWSTESSKSTSDTATDIRNSTLATSTAASPSITSTSDKPEKVRVRRRRSTDGRLEGVRKRRSPNEHFENMLQTLEPISNALQSLSAEGPVRYPANMWSNTLCSKKIFCEAMLAQPEESVAMMDKRIYTFLSLIHSDIAATVAPHLDDVMRSVKSRNCSAYTCPASWSQSSVAESGDNKRGQ